MGDARKTAKQLRHFNIYEQNSGLPRSGKKSLENEKNQGQGEVRKFQFQSENFRKK